MSDAQSTYQPFLAYPIGATIRVKIEDKEVDKKPTASLFTCRPYSSIELKNFADQILTEDQL
jgi:hypothetical protein